MMNEKEKEKCEPSRNPDASDAAGAEDIWRLKFLALYSVKYNSGLYRFYKGLHETSTIVSILVCLSVVGEILAEAGHAVSVTVALFNALLMIVSSVKNFQEKSLRYKIQYDKYFEIYRRVADGCVGRSEYCELKRKYDSYEETDIDDGLHVYGEYCYNAASIQLGVDKKYLVDIPWYKRLTRCFVGWSVIPRNT